MTSASGMSAGNEHLLPFRISVPESDLEDLARRLRATRWPERETAEGWSQGVPLGRMQTLVEYWQTRYDWRRCERMLNDLGQYRTEIDGLWIHFLHVRSPHDHALPLLLTHGWPGSVIEFHKVIPLLTDPTAHGGRVDDAFHVIIPSLPGFGFSDKPTSTGWGIERIARAWTELMSRLGYDRWLAQGGDWGAAVTTMLGKQRPAGLWAIHLNLPVVVPPPVDKDDLTEDEKKALADIKEYGVHESGYMRLQSTRPQTLGYALSDSPVAQAAWIYEKFAAWTDSGRNPEKVLTQDEMLDNIMLYWLSGTGASSARLYWESMKDFRRVELDLPVGCSIFPRELYRVPKRWADRTYRDLLYWGEVGSGGHFAAFEQPRLFVDEIRACFRVLRQRGSKPRRPAQPAPRPPSIR